MTPREHTERRQPSAARDRVDEAYKPFPPGAAQLRVPTSSRRAALAGIAMYGASRPRALWSQRIAWALVRALGPRALPGARSAWTPPLAPEPWSALLERWRAELGDFETMAVYERAQPERSGCALLLLGRAGTARAFVKLQPQASTQLGREAQALRLIAAAPPRAFRVPALLAEGELGGWVYLATSALPPQLHRPPGALALEVLAAEIERGLGALPRAPGTPAHWRPMHGDLTPWNLRALRDGSLVLLDWEETCWAPPQADAVLYSASVAALGGRLRAVAAPEEAIHFWEERLRVRAAAQPRDRALAAAQRRALAALRRAPQPDR